MGSLDLLKPEERLAGADSSNRNIAVSIVENMVKTAEVTSLEGLEPVKGVGRLIVSTSIREKAGEHTVLHDCIRKSR
jgi:hypothetical protein